MKEREIIVSSDFYLRLLEYLTPEERFTDNRGIVLMTLDTDNRAQVKKLIFVPEFDI